MTLPFFALTARNGGLVGIDALVFFRIGGRPTDHAGGYGLVSVGVDQDEIPRFAVAIIGIEKDGLRAQKAHPADLIQFQSLGRLAVQVFLVVAGYLVFFFSPMNLIPIGVAGLLMFCGQAMVVVLMIVNLSDCIEYGEWKLGRRNGAVTFAVQPFINKIGGAVATAIVGATLIVTGINTAATPDDVTAEGLLGLRVMMLFFPLALMLVSYLVYRRGYRIDEAFRERILADLSARPSAQN